MIYSDLSPVTFNASIPKKVDVVVIGGGIIGISTAWFLQRSGVSVAICDKGRVAGEQSSRNWGWIRQQGRDEAELPIMMESHRIWQSLAEEIPEDIGYHQHGVMYVGKTDKEMEEYHRWIDLAQIYGLESILLTSRQIGQRVQGLTGNWQGGVFTQSDGRAEPFVAVPAMARECQRQGVPIMENCAVRGIVRQAGSISGVFTERGEIQCQSVVCAGGAWTSLFAAHAGIGFPQLSVKSTVARTAVAPDIYKGNVACHDFALRRRADGGYTVAPADISEHIINLDSFRYFVKFLPAWINSWKETKVRFTSGAPGGFNPNRNWDVNHSTPFEDQRILNPEPTKATVHGIRQRFNKRFPAMKNIQFIESWSGMIDTMPDLVPVMDRIESIPGLFIASGFSGHGFGIGPAAGRLMADLVQGNDPGYDLHRFRFSRFTDGSKITIGPTL